MPAADGQHAPGARRDYGEWIRDSARIPLEQYETLQARFDPVRFDADLWARTAADAGMKYLVITSKHHDGFGLFDSKETTWDVMGTPFRRDVLAELSAACARHGVRFCAYHSIMDWHHPDYRPRRAWEPAAAGGDFDRFERYLHAQVTEVVTKYHPGVLWFDGEWEPTWNHERGLRLFELCRRLDPRMIVNNRVDVHRGGMGGFSESSEAVGDFATPEQEIPATGVPGLDWETCMTMNDHWGFCAADASWKTTEDLVRKLADIASKGGNFLLNVGPRADGTFPPEAVARLGEIGAWMRTNGESIHGTTASPFDALPFGRCTVGVGRAGDAVSKLYLHVFDWPKDHQLVLPGLGGELGRAYLLAEPQEDLARTREGPDARVELPAAAPDPIDTVVVLEVAGRPVVTRAPRIVADADVFVHAIAVDLQAPAPGLEVRYTTDGTDPGAASAVAQGPIRISEPGTVKARAFRAGTAVSGVAAASFRQVEPRAASVVPGSLPGLACERFEGDWSAVPDLSGAVSRGGWIAPAVALPGTPPRNPGERVALRFTGFVEVNRDDVYVFELESDDGSRLAIDGEVVVDNDGLHVAQAKRGRIALAAGAHPIEVVWFNRTGGAALALRSAPLGADLETVRRFRHAPEEKAR
jgi:alpha-L-fucosidase